MGGAWHRFEVVSDRLSWASFPSPSFPFTFNKISFEGVSEGHLGII